MGDTDDDFKSRALLAGMGIDIEDLRARREAAVRAAVAEATAALAAANGPTTSAAGSPAPSFAPGHAGAAPPRPKDAPEEIAFRQTFTVHVAGRDFQTTQEHVEVIMKAVDEGAPQIVQILARLEGQPKPFALFVNVGQIAFIRASL